MNSFAVRFEMPPLERFPFTAPQRAVYRLDAPPRGAGNPAYEALPRPRENDAAYNLVATGNPAYDPNHRKLIASARREHVDEVLTAIFPMRSHLELEDVLNSSIRNAYVGRNPAEPNFMDRSIAVASGSAPPSSGGGGGPVGTGCFLGEKGLGKTESLKRLLKHGFPQVILHDNYRGRPIALQQLAWLYLSCPPKASISGLIAWIAACLDHIFHTDVLEKVLRAKNDSLRAFIIARALSLHVTGLVVIDEIQNIEGGRAGDGATFTKFLQELINTTRTRIMLVGTPDAYAAITTDAMRRRLDGERGALRWKPLELGESWGEYLKALWEWQYTSTTTQLTAKLTETMHRLTGGTFSHAALLWTAAQSLIIGHPDHPEEKITESLLEYTMQHRFAETHYRVQAQLKQKLRILAINAKLPTANPADSSAPHLANANPVIPPPVAPMQKFLLGEAAPGYDVNQILR